MTKRLITVLLLVFSCYANSASAEFAAVVDASTDPSANESAYQTPDAEQASQETQTNLLLLNKMNQLQNDLAELRGKLEEQDHALKALSKRQNDLYQDLDQRINQLTEQPKTATIAGGSAANTEPYQTVSSEDNPLDDKNDYKSAFSLIKNKQFPAATQAMQGYLARHPQGKYAANAYYWLGELHLSQRNVNDAITSFKTVVEQFPASNKVAPSKLKLGFAYQQRGDYALAKTTLQSVVNQFPNSPTARLATARLSQLKQQGL